MLWLIFLILALLLLWLCSPSRIGSESLIISPGYANRLEVVAHIPKTFGGTDANFRKDPRFAV
jgi:hypothetical protein